MSLDELIKKYEKATHDYVGVTSYEEFLEDLLQLRDSEQETFLEVEEDEEMMVILDEDRLTLLVSESKAKRVVKFDLGKRYVTGYLGGTLKSVLKNTSMRLRLPRQDEINKYMVYLDMKKRQNG